MDAALARTRTHKWIHCFTMRMCYSILWLPYNMAVIFYTVTALFIQLFCADGLPEQVQSVLCWLNFHMNTNRSPPWDVSDGWMVSNTINKATRLFVVIFTSWQHLRSYQDGYWVVTVHTHGNFILLPHWDSKLPASWPDFTVSHIILTLSLTSHWPFQIMASTKLGKVKCKLCKVLVWLIWDLQKIGDI